MHLSLLNNGLIKASSSDLGNTLSWLWSATIDYFIPPEKPKLDLSKKESIKSFTKPIVLQKKTKKNPLVAWEKRKAQFLQEKQAFKKLLVKFQIQKKQLLSQEKGMRRIKNFYKKQEEAFNEEIFLFNQDPIKNILKKDRLKYWRLFFVLEYLNIENNKKTLDKNTLFLNKKHSILKKKDQYLSKFYASLTEEALVLKKRGFEIDLKQLKRY